MIEPAVAWLPVHAPDAVQAVAFVDVHVSVEEPDAVTWAGAIDREATGAVTTGAGVVAAGAEIATTGAGGAATGTGAAAGPGTAATGTAPDAGALSPPHAGTAKLNETSASARNVPKSRSRRGPGGHVDRPRRALAVASSIDVGRLRELLGT